MFFGKRPQQDKIEELLVETQVYSCSDDLCIGWMRKGFATEDLNCPMCGNSMLEEIRELPKM